MNFEINCQLKEKRKSNFEKYQKQKEKILKEKKEHVNLINHQRNQSLESKKQNEFEKKLKIKEDLIKKIQEEENKKLDLQKEVNLFETESKILINNIKNLNHDIHKQ